MPYLYQVFIHKGLDVKGGAQHHVLSSVSNVSELLHKTAAGIPVS